MDVLQESKKGLSIFFSLSSFLSTESSFLFWLSVGSLLSGVLYYIYIIFFLIRYDYADVYLSCRDVGTIILSDIIVYVSLFWTSLNMFYPTCFDLDHIRRFKHPLWKACFIEPPITFDM